MPQGMEVWSAGINLPGCIPSQQPVCYWESVESRKGFDAVQVLLSNNKNNPCVFNTVFSTNLKHTPMLATMMKINYSRYMSAHADDPNASSLHRLQNFLAIPGGTDLLYKC